LPIPEGAQQCECLFTALYVKHLTISNNRTMNRETVVSITCPCAYDNHLTSLSKLQVMVTSTGWCQYSTCHMVPGCEDTCT